MSEARCPTCHRAYRQDRTNNQNRYYWGVVVKLLSEHTGFSDDEMHEVLKYKFLTKAKILNTKKGIEEVFVGKSTTRLSTKAFEEFMTQIRQWASIDLGVWVPEPNEVPYEND